MHESQPEIFGNEPFGTTPSGGLPFYETVEAAGDGVPFGMPYMKEVNPEIPQMTPRRDPTTSSLVGAGGACGVDDSTGNSK